MDVNPKRGKRNLTVEHVEVLIANFLSKNDRAEPDFHRRAIVNILTNPKSRKALAALAQDARACRALAAWLETTLAFPGSLP